jgi:thiol-disulfide isomerase/thioredoxin
MRSIVTTLHIGLCLAFVFALAPASHAADTLTIAGRWDGVIQAKEGVIPYAFEIAGNPDNVAIVYFDGTTPVRHSSGGTFRDGALHVDFASYDAVLDARLGADNVLRGTTGALPFEARRAGARPASTASAPDIAGVWEIPFDSTKGEKAWRLIVEQKKAAVDATILRIDGDTGLLSGGYDGKVFNLSRYAGERAYALTVTPAADGTLSLVLLDPANRRELKALRPAAARAAGLAAPSDPTRHTGVKDPTQPFPFSGYDLEGRLISSTDERFKGKVVVLNIMGSWCPNCHDEAPFLAELDAKYRAQGLEVVSLNFELKPEELKELKRLRAFIKRYDLRYSVLTAGVRDDANAKLPQAENLNAWPTTFFIGRDGKVHSVHVGFPSQGNTAFIAAAKADIVKVVEGLIAARS